MHEMALMGDIVQLVWDSAKERGFKKVSKIELIVGTLSNAMPDALEMAFSVYRAQHVDIFTPDAILEIEVEEALAKCVACGHEYRPDQKLTICPSCGMPTGNLVRGETFRVKSYEGRE